MKKRNLLLLATLALILVVTVMIAGCENENANLKKGKTGLAANEINNEKFKDLFPLQYNSFMETKEMSDTTYAGSKPRSKYSADKEPLLPILFNGSPFSMDYKEDRGHIYALEDVAKTLRITDKSPGACLTCKSSAVPLLVEEMGDNYWGGSFKSEILPKAEEMGHSSVGCSDCHDPQTMDLRVTRTPFIKAMEARGVDVKKATRDEMRSYVCGQCHSEYYFAPSNKEVVFPWNNGYKAEEMLSHYEKEVRASGFTNDFIHNISGTETLKAQHPDFETYMEGPHAKAGVSCSDCHMQYERVDSKKKVSSHNWTSPLKTMDTSCGNCHSSRDMKDLAEQVIATQGTFKTALDKAEEISVTAHYYVNKMITSGVPKAKIEAAQKHVRTAQWLWDFCAAENGTGFHNPQGGMDNLMKSSNESNEAIAIATEELVKKGVNITELKAEIQKVIHAVENEKDVTAKKNHAINTFFPAQQPVIPATPAKK